MKKLAILNFCFLIFVSVYSTQTKWTAEDLNNYYTKQKYPSFLDPDGYVKSEETIREINSIIKSIYSEKNYDTKLFIVSEMSDKYKYFFSKDINLFLNDLSYLLLGGDETKDADTCFILFSINDKLMRIRTGKNARYYISDSEAKKYLNSIKSEMRSQDYGAASKKLLNKILSRVVNGNPYLENLISWIFFSLIIIGGCIFFIISSIVGNRKYYLTATAKERLEKIKLISEQNKSKKEFVQTTCVICLDDFKMDSGEEYENNIQKSDKHVSLCEVNTLQCGHSFHSSCIATWMDKSNQCPTCRHQIDDEVNTRKVAEGLILVQTAYHPNLANYNFNYNNGFVWNRHVVSTGNSGGSSYSNNWGISGGGATSSW